MDPEIFDLDGLPDQNLWITEVRCKCGLEEPDVFEDASSSPVFLHLASNVLLDKIQSLEHFFLNCVFIGKCEGIIGFLLFFQLSGKIFPKIPKSGLRVRIHKFHQPEQKVDVACYQLAAIQYNLMF